MNVLLIPASHQEMQTIRHFFLDYSYAISQYDENLIINEAGLPMWKPFGFPGPQTPEECVSFNWWIRNRCEHYLIRVENTPAGFVMICTQKDLLPPAIDYELLDFSITPKYRRQGIGREAALQALELYRGRWVLYQLEKNLPARAFWQTVLSAYTRGKYTNLDGGTQQRFSN